MDEIIEISKWQQRLKDFGHKRDWKQFHDPKNFAMALNVEAGELLEIFQWLNSDESFSKLKEDDFKLKVAEEVSDIFFYLIQFADITGINLNEALEHKIKMNEDKYPTS